MTDLTKQNETAVAIPKEFQGFTEEEVMGGMAPIQEGYLKSYKYFLSRPSLLGEFQIIDNATDEVIWEGSEIKGATIYYGHEVIRLKRGHVESPEKKENDFTDEENEILAVTYDPLNSKGNFEINGYGQYLTKEHEEIRGNMTRLYLFMILPKSYKTGVDIVAASFSVTTVMSFNALRKVAKGYNIPLPLVRTNIFFSNAESKNKTKYQRIDFTLAKDADGNLQFAHPSIDVYRTSPYGVKMLNEIALTHRAAVENAEGSNFGTAVTEKEIPSPGQEFAESLKESFKGTDVDPNGDDMPF